jgi:UDP-GlcNAc:undecaprenyl-phosphate/decaprenyl-phosphate GlcNAc-1-phosphate transferase
VDLALLGLGSFLTAVLIASLVTPAVRGFCLRVGWLDHGRAGRAMHDTPTPRLGGIALAAAFYGPLVLVGLTQHQAADLLLADGRRVLALVVGGLFALGIGATDDILHLSARRKLVMQIALASVVALLGLRIELLEVPFVGVVQMGLFSVPATVLWLVLVMNAINLIDGLDGLAAGVSLTVVAALLAVSVHNDMAVGVLLGSALAGALAGFLRHNFPPASVFMGDSGSLFLGFALGAWSLVAWQKSATGVAVLSVALIFALPLLDVALAVGRRLGRGQSPLVADADHLHHRLVRQGLSHRRSVLVLYAVAVVTTGSALAMLYLGPS